MFVVFLEKEKLPSDSNSEEKYYEKLLKLYNQNNAQLTVAKSNMETNDTTFCY